MIARALAIATLIAFAMLVLLAPALCEPGHFVRLLREEHQANTAFWGREVALSVLAENLAHPVALPKDEKRAPPPPAPAARPGTKQLVNAGDVFSRLNGNFSTDRYLEAVGSLLMLAGYRASFVLAGAAGLMLFALAAVIDGSIERTVRGRLFIMHDPEIFAVSAVCMLLVCCLGMLAVVAPIGLHPLVLPLVFPLAALMLNRAVANYRL